ncbi:hypothetical protein TBLA_0I01830 [Henningerozyma blattae CBS 6284]|uniref:Factor-induced gene 1 protein n=1 Tax=Henningerozyma blattae (strain ATCC 34711 / CBS 6284 / DSM 70876 / NBRC 10599 / NRRL Y-10934 / UCD 77-7) TaxID=1071380 RepID=I2H8Y9_HENB6|nr:hypothetical protein TBLA_0I01830 [Tetrapisispora blattae CBS 6284]CCH62841.1 hypothetical protein TBLA_0I01830 [Tetrapisispora blattae CBS 6284]
MIPASSIWFCLKRMPRILALTFNIIVIFISIFLLVGCSNTSNMSTFITKYTFDSQSPFYSVIQKSFQNSKKLKGLENIKVKAGFLGICISNIPTNYYGNITSICYPKKKIDQVSLYKDVAIELINQSTSNSTTQAADLNILELARITNVNVIHPYILIATIALICALCLLVIYVTIPYPSLPLRYQINKLILIWTAVLILLWGIGSTWLHVGVHSSRLLVPSASMGMVKVQKGKKASAMSWFCFAGLLIETCILWGIYIRDRKTLSQEINEIHTHSKNDTEMNKKYSIDSEPYNKYASDSSTLH